MHTVLRHGLISCDVSRAALFEVILCEGFCIGQIKKYPTLPNGNMKICIRLKLIAYIPMLIVLVY